MGPRPFTHKEVHRLLVPAGKAFSLLTDDLITSLSLSRKSGSRQTIHNIKANLGWLYLKGIWGVGYGPRPFGLNEIDGLLVPTGKVSTQLTVHLIADYPLRSKPAQEKWLMSNHP